MREPWNLRASGVSEPEGLEKQEALKCAREFLLARVEGSGRALKHDQTPGGLEPGSDQ